MEEIYVNLTENAHIPDILLRTEVLMEMVGIVWTIIENNLMYKIKIPVGFSETNHSIPGSREIRGCNEKYKKLYSFFYREKRTLE